MTIYQILQNSVKMFIRRVHWQLWNIRRCDKHRRKFLMLFCIIFQYFFGDDASCTVPRQLWWVHPMNVVWGMPGKGKFHAQVQELKAYPDHFLGYFRIPLNKYFQLVNRIRNNWYVAKQNMNFWRCIAVEERVAVFLR